MKEHCGKILVLGGSGFVGRNLVHHLRSSGHQSVYAPSRRELDVTDFSLVEDMIHNMRIEVVVNCAASTGIRSIETAADATEKLNIEVPTRWAEICERNQIRFIHLSTDQVFDGNKKSPYCEADEPAAVSRYGHTKMLGEKAVRNYVRHAIVRTSFVFGRGGNTFMSRIPLLLNSTEPLRVVTDIKASCTSITTLCRCLSWVISSDAKGVFHVANNGETTWALFAEQCAEDMLRLGYEVRCPPIIKTDYEKVKAALGPRALYSVLDTIKIEQACGYRLTGWREEIPAFVCACLAAGQAIQR